MRRYNNRILPTIDLYLLAGEDAMDQMEAKPGKKNLLVVPFAYVNQLERHADSGKGGAAQAIHAMDHMMSKGKLEEYGMVVEDYREGLDVLFIGESSDQSVQLRDLEDRLQEITPDTPPTEFISSKPGARARLRRDGLSPAEPQFLIPDEDIVNRGIILGNNDLLSELYEKKEVSVTKARELLGADTPFVPNQFIKFLGNTDVYARHVFTPAFSSDNTRMIGRKNERVILVGDKDTSYGQQEAGRVIMNGKRNRRNILGVKMLDMEQYLAMQYGILDPNVSIMFLCGEQGSGKTLLGYVGAMDQVFRHSEAEREARGPRVFSSPNSEFERIYLFKPTERVGGQDLGFLPGDLEAKLGPDMESYRDVHRETSLNSEFEFEELLLHAGRDDGAKRRKKARINGMTLPEHQILHFMASGYTRGRTLSNSLLLIDEAQGFSPYELKTLIERIGEGSKAIIMGDPTQVEQGRDLTRNGLVHGIMRYLEKPYTALVNLPHSYRSQASEDARGWIAFH